MQLRHPVRIVRHHGLSWRVRDKDDPILSAWTRTALAERHPEASRLTLPAGGHYPCVTQIEVYNQFILSAVLAAAVHDRLQRRH
jgi:pimeloyl-ACP methyl ester carboxylesterase